MKKKISLKRQLIYPLIPAIALAGYMIISPLLAFPIKIPITGETIFYLPEGFWIDYCVASREILTFAAAMVLLFYFLGERIFPDKPLKAPILHSKHIRPPLAFLGVYVLWAVISSVFSEYNYICLMGFPAEPEGLLSVFGCTLLFIAAFNCMSYPEVRKTHKLLSVMFFGTMAIITVMSVIEFFIPMITLFFGEDEIDRRLSLLYGNSTNCGVVCAVLFSAGTVFCCCEKKYAVFAVKIALTAFILLCVIHSKSSTALYSALFSAAVGCLILFIKHKGRFLNLLLTIAADIVCVIVLQFVNTNSVADVLVNNGAYDPTGSFMLTDIQTKENCLFLTNESGILELILEDGELYFEKNGEKITFAQSEDGTATLDGEYSMVSVILSDGLLSLDLGYSKPIYFEITGDEFQYIGLNGYIEEMSDSPPFPELSKYYRLGTGRVYIWLNTVSMLKDCLFKGYGAGEYVFYYPHGDIVGSLNTHGVVPLITTKPHCMYLQIFTSYGLPAFLAFVCFSLLVLKRGITASLSDEYGIAAALIAGILCFLISGAVNDSNSTFSVWFWVMAGAAEALYEKNL